MESLGREEKHLGNIVIAQNAAAHLMELRAWVAVICGSWSAQTS